MAELLLIPLHKSNGFGSRRPLPFAAHELYRVVEVDFSFWFFSGFSSANESRCP